MTREVTMRRDQLFPLYWNANYDGPAGQPLGFTPRMDQVLVTVGASVTCVSAGVAGSPGITVRVYKNSDATNYLVDETWYVGAFPANTRVAVATRTFRFAATPEPHTVTVTPAGADSAFMAGDIACIVVIDVDQVRKKGKKKAPAKKPKVKTRGGRR